MDLPVMPPIAPMLAKLTKAIPEGEFSYEPKWDGFRCVIFRDGDELVLSSRNQKPLGRYFPELAEPLKAALPLRCVLDGELVVPVESVLDFDALSQRIHPAASRVASLAAATPAEFIAFDVLSYGDRDLMDDAFSERREQLELLSEAFAGPVHLAPATHDRGLASRWFEEFEAAGLDGLIVKDLAAPYVPGKRTQLKVKHIRTADCVVAGYRRHTSGDGVGSLLLGLYDSGGGLRHVGVAASFTAKRRRELAEELTSLEDIAPEEHPWAGWDDGERSEDGAMPGAPNRWSGATGRDHSWIPLRPERVVEVRYTWATAGRFRGTAKMLRWRPDRDATSCLAEQLDQPPPMGLHKVLGAASGSLHDDSEDSRR